MIKQSVSNIDIFAQKLKDFKGPLHFKNYPSLLYARVHTMGRGHQGDEGVTDESLLTAHTA